jgi:DNA-binding beta-propeller fold protein YncE
MMRYQHLPRSATIFRLLTLAITLAAAGCAQPVGNLFEPQKQPLRWPAAPERARIQYVGQLAGSADLKPGMSMMQGLSTAMFGADPTFTLLTPFAVCTDGKDRLFIADSNAQLVHVMNTKTREYAQWKPDTGKMFSQPVAVAYDPIGKRLIVSDSVGGVLFAFDDTGKPLGQLAVGSFKRPCGLAVDPTTGRIFCADVAAHQVVVLSPQGNEIARIGQRGEALGEFNYPTAVALDRHGRLYVSDSLNFRVQQFGPDFKPIKQIGSQGDMPGYFSQPRGLAVDGEDHLYVLDAQFEAVQIFDDQGQLLLAFGEEGHGPGQFWLPTGICIDPANRIWIADSYNRRVQVFDYLPEGKP